MSLGIGADRMRTVSYGKEFPFDSAHRESALLEESAGPFRDHREVSELMTQKIFAVVIGLLVVGRRAARPPPTRSTSS
jgi:hypothetical protein